jgi:hypothetical protein
LPLWARSGRQKALFCLVRGPFAVARELFRRSGSAS